MESLLAVCRSKLGPSLFPGISSRIWLCSSCASVSGASLHTRSDRERNICNKKHFGQYKNHSNASCSRQFSTNFSQISFSGTGFLKKSFPSLSSSKANQDSFSSFFTQLLRLPSELRNAINLSISDAINWIGKTSPTSQMRPDGMRPDGTHDTEGKNEQDPEKDPKEDEKVPYTFLTFLIYAGVILYAMLAKPPAEHQNRNISWNDFVYDMLAKGEVESILVYPDIKQVNVMLHPGAIVKGKQHTNVSEGSYYVLSVPELDQFEEKLRKVEMELGISSENYVPIVYNRRISYYGKLFTFATIACIIILLKGSVKLQFPNPSEMFAKERKANFIRVDLMTRDGKGITFKDVAGLHEAKVEVMEFVDYLKKPEHFAKIGAKIPKGALLLGPPGCGKTLLAKAVATESKVPFLAMAGSEFVEMIGGLGAARVRDLFKEARKRSPCIVYIDEIDAIGRKRSGNNWSDNAEEEHTLNQLLVEMDGIGTTEGVIILASTNRSEILDKALLRAGRFDRHILIDYPTLAERREIFDIYLKKLKLAKMPTEYSENLAQLSPGMSGADIANICNEAALHAARIKNLSVDANDFEYAVERVTVGVAKKSRILSPQEKKIVAYHEAGHALVGWLLKHTDSLMKVSIVPRTDRTLGYAQYMPQDKKLLSQDALFEQMCLLLGGRVAETLTFNNVTTGAQDDLQKVTKMAYDQIRLMGMNEKIGLVSYPTDDSNFGGKPYSKQTARIMDAEAKLLINKVYKFTEKLLQDNKEKLRIVAEALLEKEALSYKEMEQLVGPPTHGSKGFLPSEKPLPTPVTTVL